MVHSQGLTISSHKMVYETPCSSKLWSVSDSNCSFRGTVLATGPFQACMTLSCTYPMHDGRQRPGLSPRLPTHRVQDNMNIWAMLDKSDSTEGDRHVQLLL